MFHSLPLPDLHYARGKGRLLELPASPAYLYQTMPTAPACAIVIFGASGDLAQRKLIPAIYEMAREKLLNERTYVVGFARSPMSDEQYRKESSDAVMKFAVRPFSRRRIERRPDQERMLLARLGPHPQQPWHVEARKWADDARRLL